MEMKLFAAFLAFIVAFSGCIQPVETIEPEAEPSPSAEPSQEPSAVSVELSGFPESVSVGGKIAIKWRVNSDIPFAINHTAIHFSYSPHPGDLGLDAGPAASGYTEIAGNFASGSFSIPANFEAEIIPSLSGTIYFRAHAIVAGKNYWTEEQQVQVEAIEAPAGASDEEIIEAKGISLDSGLDSSSDDLETVRTLE
jgi:hypothetical protein